MNLRIIFSIIGILIGGILILTSLNKSDVIKIEKNQLTPQKNLEDSNDKEKVLSNLSGGIAANASGITFDLYKNRFFISGNFPKEELEKVVKNIEQGKDPGTQYSAFATTPARGVKVKPLANAIGGGSENNNQPENFPKLLDYKVPGQLEGQSCYNIGKLANCPSGYEDSDKNCIVCVNSPASFKVSESDVDPRPYWTGGGGLQPAQQGRPNVPYPYPNQGDPAPGLTEPNNLGEKCYKTRDGKIWCARSPAYSLSPYRGSTIPGGPIGACGYNKQRQSEQCGTDQWPDQLEIGVCRDITHSAWTPCGPGAPPLQPEETSRGLPLTTPPCITWGGCSFPCVCWPLPSGNCKGNLWCVGPPGCNCCPGLACNVCCQNDNYLWDSVTGWCACASGGTDGRGRSIPSKDGVNKYIECRTSYNNDTCEFYEPISCKVWEKSGKVIAQEQLDPKSPQDKSKLINLVKIYYENNSEPNVQNIINLSKEEFLKARAGVWNNFEGCNLPSWISPEEEWGIIQELKKSKSFVYF